MSDLETIEHLTADVIRLAAELAALRRGVAEVRSYCDCQAPLWGDDGGSAFTLVEGRLAQLLGAEQ